MALPKSVLCVMDDNDFEAEKKLRASGFATATLYWKEIHTQPNMWMQLAEILDDSSVRNCIFAGTTDDFMADTFAKISLLKLGLNRKIGPTFALLSPSCESIAPPPLLSDMLLFKPGAPVGAKLIAKTYQPELSGFEAPCRLKAYLDSVVGLWLELGPASGEWNGFMLGVTAAEITAFGVGPKGVIPQKSTLAYPMLGIKGDLVGRSFSACAAKNSLDTQLSCFLRVEGIPESIFVADYPDDTNVSLDCRFPVLRLS